MTTIRVPPSLKTENINGYSETSLKKKQAFHVDGKKFLARLAKELGLEPATFDLRNNEAGMAVSGEVTLHADHLYVQLSESALSRGVQMLYRSCTSRKDYTGGANNYSTLVDFAHAEKQEGVIRRMHSLMGQARQDALAA